MEVRLRLEPQLAALAALRAKPVQIARMHELSDRIAQCVDADEGELWDGTLHRQIAEAAGNALFLSLFDVVNRIRQDPPGRRCANARGAAWPVTRCPWPSTAPSSTPSPPATRRRPPNRCACIC